MIVTLALHANNTASWSVKSEHLFQFSFLKHFTVHVVSLATRTPLYIDNCQNSFPTMTLIMTDFFLYDVAFLLLKISFISNVTFTKENSMQVNCQHCNQNIHNNSLLPFTVSRNLIWFELIPIAMAADEQTPFSLQFSPVNKMHIFQCMGEIFCMEFQRGPLKFHTKYLTHTFKDAIFIQSWNFKSSWIKSS